MKLIGRYRKKSFCKSQFNRKAIILGTLLCAGSSLSVSKAYALDTQQDDFVPVPANTFVLLGYYEVENFNEFDSLGSGKIDKNTHYQAQVGIIRPAYYFSVLGMPALINALQTFGGYTASELDGNTAQRAGVELGDLTIGSFLWPINNPAKDEYLALGGYVHLPDGNYNSKLSTNLTDNRVSGTVQAAFIHRLIPKVDIQVVSDATFYGDNTNATSTGGTLREHPVYETQLWSMYHYSPLTTLAFGVAGTYGGYSSVDGVATGDMNEYQQIKVSYTHFFPAPKLQLEVEADHAFHAVGYFKEDYGFVIRIAKVF